ncbi:hypothetical protein T440DRAFT_142308 [Plenodomus tracheiphilus IPT5]|uniref:Uncharacterized protein n=1 Tax=Plenodomus tracheiphilus IPT5 TaxID=1408161 RepID=A0A6A7B0B6_9PLEO|nr:hypothetical protein T440DRAFT_142308 [Plenodomus tracheiphilus IPT5]
MVRTTTWAAHPPCRLSTASHGEHNLCQVSSEKSTICHLPQHTQKLTRAARHAMHGAFMSCGSPHVTMSVMCVGTRRNFMRYAALELGPTAGGQGKDRTRRERDDHSSQRGLSSTRRNRLSSVDYAYMQANTSGAGLSLVPSWYAQTVQAHAK